MLRLALGALLLLTGASADLLPLPGFAAGLLGNRQDIKVCSMRLQHAPCLTRACQFVSALPPNVKAFSAEANSYFIRWLQCSALTAWCTPTEVYSLCTYEPSGSWYKGSSAINSGRNWKPCLPELPLLYAHCDFISIQMDACDFTAIAKRLNVTLSPQRGASAPEIAALPPWPASGNIVFPPGAPGSSLTNSAVTGWLQG